MYYRYVEDTGITPVDWLDLVEQSEFKAVRSEIDAMIRDAAKAAASKQGA